MKGLISIIVPVYNVEKYLDRCIQSLISQSYKNIEIILVNDGSLDNSGAICDKYSKDDNRIISIHKKNGGVSSARNTGIKNSRGEFIAFCDSDDWVDKDIYVELVKLINKNNSDLACCEFFDLEKVDINNDETYLENTIDRNYALKLILDDDKIGGYLWNKLFRRSTIFNSNLLTLDTKIHVLEDEIFVLEYIKKCEKIAITKKQLYHYEKNENSALNSPISEKTLTAIDAREKIYMQIKQVSDDDSILYLAWGQLIKNCVLFYKKIIFSNSIKNKNMYLSKIKSIIKKYINDYKFGEDFSIKDKIYYYLVKFT